ncbi:MAG: nitrate ABC transporter substrate-binding protein [Rhodospirillaceae bacterium]|jgi:NitT/TauT family transport system substrate-binding protein|nr:nitrate ABC transporter substrate-binding protein [Rhodospirillaceae bacterium]|tara:strand:- start:1320 stop:2285 length:966 start_codon:yes stop_codon:yes gene_type:complete
MFIIPVVAVATLLAASNVQKAQAEDVTYLLPAPPFLPAFAPWMLAKARGYYKSEGLNVKFQMARGGVDVAKQVGAGNAVVGGGIGDTSMIVRPNGIPVKAVAVLGGGSLMHLTAHADRGINGPADLKGKTVTTLAFQDTTFYALLGMLASQGLSRKDINAQAAGPAGVWKLFMAGKADAMASVPDWTAIAIGAGKKVKIFPADDYFKSMAQAILVADKTIKENPALVQKLVRATLKGMAGIMNDPDQATKDYTAFVAKNKGKDKYIKSVFAMYNKYVYPGQKKIGAMDRARLASLQKFYVKSGIVRKAQPLDDLYTNQFIQ